MYENISRRLRKNQTKKRGDGEKNNANVMRRKYLKSSQSCIIATIIHHRPEVYDSKSKSKNPAINKMIQIQIQIQMKNIKK